MIYKSMVTFLIFFLILSVTPCLASDVVFSWDKNPVEEDITGYTIYYQIDGAGPAPLPDEFQNALDVLVNSSQLKEDDAGHLQFTLTDLEDEQYYWITVKAYRMENTLKVISGYAVPVTTRPPSEPGNNGSETGNTGGGGGGGCFVSIL